MTDEERKKLEYVADALGYGAAWQGEKDVKALLLTRQGTKYREDAKEAADDARRAVELLGGVVNRLTAIEDRLARIEAGE